MHFRCHGCNAVIDTAQLPPFRCPGHVPGDDVDHVLAPDAIDGAFPAGTEDNPFLRYRTVLSPYCLAHAAGLSESTWTDIVGALDAAVLRITGRGFRVTPMIQQNRLATALKFTDGLWIKDETGNVAGSHKARHLMGVMLYLRVLELAKLPAGSGLRRRRLAIASCGNAALAAAVIARAADWGLDVFIPPDADAAVKQKLTELGANITTCERRFSGVGDPCFLRFREAVEAGAIPFSVQGTENGLTVEGGRTLAFEMIEQFCTAGIAPDILFVQVGGGALASALSQGFALGLRLGLIARLPKLIAVQTRACAPLARAWSKSDGLDLASLARHRSRFMWPWEDTTATIATGIIDGETYDWWAVVEGMRASGGHPIVVEESMIVRAHKIGCLHTGIPASPTGTAGLAGAMVLPAETSRAAVIFSGVDHHA